MNSLVLTLFWHYTGTPLVEILQMQFQIGTKIDIGGFAVIDERVFYKHPYKERRR